MPVRGYLLKTMQLGHITNHSPWYSAKVNNAWSYTSTQPSICLRGTYRDNFTTSKKTGSYLCSRFHNSWSVTGCSGMAAWKRVGFVWGNKYRWGTAAQTTLNSSWRDNLYCDNTTTYTVLPINQSLRFISNNSLRRWYELFSQNRNFNKASD